MNEREKEKKGTQRNEQTNKQTNERKKNWERYDTLSLERIEAEARKY